jgi:hypothetical protein
MGHARAGFRKGSAIAAPKMGGALRRALGELFERIC